jgi:hypothetical protein
VASIPENSVGDVSVKTVLATDTDHNPDDQDFTFTILDGNNENLFKIDQNNGLVTTTGVGILDRVTILGHIILILCQPVFAHTP